MLQFTGFKAGSVRNFKPRVMGFCCNWAACLGFEQAGINENQYSPDLHLLLVTCAGSSAF